ncbi:hypothetical protein NVP1193O_242 [Vibrio phage 1.193.O._10N.286.52.C6]|nr:hypothetical protein NVP1193O_242 [Vibrio phage 1.193.O._10N.286.52.C6]
MAQYPTFYKYHKEHGTKFKRLLVDTGLIDRKLGFPISAIDDIKAYNLYVSAINAKRVIKYALKIGKATQRHFIIYHGIRSKYLNYIPQYHKVREY